MSQDEIGTQVGATRRTIHAWERNQTSPTVDKLLRWAKATGFPATWFIEDLDDTGVTQRYRGCTQPRLTAIDGGRMWEPEPVPAGFAQVVGF